MQQLPNSEREVITFAAEVGLPTFFPKVGPDFSRWCGLPVMAHSFLVTHPHFN
jgi:hypothetical protein